MRHFAEELRALGYTVDYYQVQPNAKSALTTHIGKFRPARFRLMETAEYGRSKRLAELIRRQQIDSGSPSREIQS
jgi:deoxyribodipyrimidine photolyase-related protein